MRTLVLAAALMTLPMAARAAEPVLSDEFQAICIANRADLSKALSTARARGYQPLGGDAPDGVATMSRMSKTVDGKVWAMVVATGGSPANGGMPAQNFIACNVTGPVTGPASAQALRRWVGIAPQTATEIKSIYYFTETAGGRRSAIDPEDNAGLINAMNANGFSILQIDIKPAATAFTLSQSTRAQ